VAAPHNATESMRPSVSDRPVVRVVHPCGAVDEHLDALERGLGRLEGAGCRVRWDPRRACDKWRDYFAGDDRKRADELIAALEEPEVEVVWFARGGGGAGRLLDALIPAVARLEPRAVVGFSDATSILNVLATDLGWTTYHGPVVASLGRPTTECDLNSTLGVLTGDVEVVRFMPRAGADVSGTLRGGNLTVLCSLLGTRFVPPAAGTVWLLEDVQEPAYRLDRAFWQLRCAGLLDRASAVWVGDLGLEPDQQEGVRRMFREDAGAVPVIEGAPAGHYGRIDALPIGARVTLRPSAGVLEFGDMRPKT
jgi:muramoyltetrapeptide carboxypeptidase